MTDEMLQTIVADFRQPKHLRDAMRLPTDPNEAAAVALGVISDPLSPVLPAEIFEGLKRRNQALQGEGSAAEIKEALGRQAVLLEHLSMRFLAQAAKAKSDNAVHEFTRSGLSASKTLLRVLGALHAMNKDKDEFALAVED